jgi:hypothetical protein
MMPVMIITPSNTDSVGLGVATRGCAEALIASIRRREQKAPHGRG